MKNVWHIGLLLLLNLLSVRLCAQFENKYDFYFDRLEIHSGNALITINDLVKDQKGLLWIATNRGIYLYDGYEYELIDNNNPHIKGVTDPNIKILRVTKNNNILACSNNGDILMFDYSSYSFKKLDLPDKTQKKIKNVGETLDGKIFAHIGNKLFLYHDQKSIFEVKDVISNIFAYNNFTITTKKDLLLLQNKEKTITTELPSEIENEKIVNVIPNGESVYIATRSKGIWKYGLANNSYEKYVEDLPIIKDAKLDKKGNFWLTHPSKGISIVYNNKNVTHITQQIGFKGTIASNNLGSIYIDDNNVVFLKGLTVINLFDAEKRKFSHINHIKYDNNTLSDAFVRGVYKDGKTLWVATNDGMVNLISENKPNIDHVKLTSKKYGRVTGFDFLRINKEEVLVATNLGLFRYNQTTKLLTEDPIFNSVQHQFARVRQITPYDKNTLYLASPEGLYEYKIKEKKIRLFKHNALGKDQIIKTVYVDPVDSNLWVGTNGTLEYFDVKSKKFTSYQYVPKDQKDTQINFMALSIERAENSIWIGTFNLGLVRFNLETKQIQYITTSEGLPNNVVYSSVYDGENLWLGTNEGLSKLSLKTNKITNYSEQDGVQGPEFNRLAYDKDGDFLYMGGTTGLNIIDFKKVNKPINDKEYFSINKVTIFNHFIEGSNQNIKYLLTGRNDIRLKYDENYLKFNFSSSNVNRSESLPYYYKLEGFDKDWVKTTSNFVYYPNLHPGNYRFKVARNPEAEQSASIQININTPIWKRPVFYFLLILVIIGIISTVLYLNFQRSKQLKLKLKNEISKRTHELNSSKNELEALNRKKDVLFSILSHDLRSPLNSLKGFLDILIRAYGTMDEKEVKHHASKISDSISNSLDLIENTLNWSVSEMGNLKFTPSKTNINQLINKAIDLYLLVAENKGIKIQQNYDAEYFAFGDENTIFLIFRNLLSNAIKFTEAGKSIFITITEVDNNILVSFKDEGVGVPDDLFEDVLNLDTKEVKRGTNNEKGTGLGLVLCSQFIKVNNGEIWINKEYKNGAEFIISLPKFDEQLNIGKEIKADPKFSKVGVVSLF